MSANGCEVLVIGEGLSGIVAAATAAMQGSRVTLVSKGPGNFVLGSGCIDLDGQDRATRFDDDRRRNGCPFLSGSDGLCRLSPTAAAYGERRLVPTVLGSFQEASRWRRAGCGRPILPTSAKCRGCGIANLPSLRCQLRRRAAHVPLQRCGLTTSYRSEIVTLPTIPSHALTALEIASHIDRDNDYRSALARAAAAGGTRCRATDPIPAFWV